MKTTRPPGRTSLCLTSAGVTALATLLLPAVTAAWQPERPRLDADADTNDARVYYEHGVERLWHDEADRAVAAFSWATRLDPTWAEPIYGLRIASMAEDMGDLVAYLEGQRDAFSNEETRRFDSLAHRATVADPLMHTGLDEYLINAYVRRTARSGLFKASVTDDLRRRVVELELERYLAQETPYEWRAWRSYTQGEWEQALEWYDSTLVFGEEADFHVFRARIHHALGRGDSAVAAMRRAIELDSSESLIRMPALYRTPEALAYTLGRLLEEIGEDSLAREAYAEAFLADLSFYPAHLRLSELALREGDSATALEQLDMAIALEPDDVLPSVMRAELLLDMGNPTRAAEDYRRAIAREPLYAEPYLPLGIALQKTGDFEGAAAAYQAFLDRAPRTHRRLDEARARLAVVRRR